jgi:nicotinamidase/pyrazinamidase
MRDHRTGATVPTELDGLLRSHGVRRVVIGGLATDYCVRATVLDALALGYATHVLVDGVRPVEIAAGDGERALAEMERAGAVLVHRSAAAVVVEGRA